MILTGTVPIETDRLLLRRFTLEDAEAIFSNWASDPEVTKYLTWPTHADLDTTRSVLKGWLKGYDDGSIYNWALTRKSDGLVMGSIGLAEIHAAASRCDIGYCLGRAYWGWGYMSEALGFVLHFLLTDMEFNRAQAFHAVDNPASGRVMEKAGMTYEGTLRGYICTQRGYSDVKMYALLREEYDHNRRMCTC